MIQQTLPPQLTVYKASAGSGKTFTLAREYMTLVIANPMAYRTILAVTFTNKATEEMKLRILGQLYGISQGLDKSHDYLVQIAKALPHLSVEQIKQNAAKALQLLLHNYNHFRVETIDTFFQSVLRNLARELDLTANLRIGLNDRQVEQQAVDELIESLESTDKLLFWIMDYIRENIDEDKGWNIIGQVKLFGENIFRDYYKAHADELSKCMEDEKFFEAFKAKMRETRAKVKEQLYEIASTFFDALEENGYTAEDLTRGKTGIWSYFNKLRNGTYDDEDLCNATFAKCMDSPDNWVRKADAKAQNELYCYVRDILYPILQFSEKNRPKLVRIYKSVSLTMKHLNQLRLLSSIDKKVRLMNEEANRFLLSDTQTLLHSLIQDSDSPFIFEKIGTQLDHVMIDEFQDTSTIQWKNFKVLLEETMSREDAGNLIVGDVKQSIYRWRSGDWRLLNNIEQEFAESGKTVKSEPLRSNYRSDRNVIDFNNAFFTEAANIEYNYLKEDTPEEAEELRRAYSDVIQEVPQNRAAQGYVEVRLLKESNDEEGQDRMLQLCLSTVDDLVGRGVSVSDIAILVRNNKTIQDIAQYFMDHSNYEMVSDEAFRLDASQAVNTLVAVLRHLTHPNDAISRAIVSSYADYYLHDEKKADFFDEHRQELLETPLFELVERIYRILEMGENTDMKQQSAYVCAFYDKLNAFLADNSSDIEAFLKEWDENLHDKSIHSDGDNGIRLLTIHKSKGLEYDHVIMPYCDWQLEKTNTIWCSPQEEPYCQLPLVPVDFSAKQMKQSIYERDYYHEHLQNMVDNLNLLYVAFTRASHNLYVFGKQPKKSANAKTSKATSGTTRSGIIEAVLPQVEKVLAEKGLSCQLVEDETGDVFFSYGEPVVPAAKERKTSLNVFEQTAEKIQVTIHHSSSSQTFKQSLQSRDFIEGDEEEEQQKHYIKMGTVMHAIFSAIHTHEDIEGALKDLEQNGVLYDDHVSRERLVKMIRQRLESEKVKDWFSGRWTLFNECTILRRVDDKLVQQRPDRVMKGADETVVVDFKFGKPHEEYFDQVREYMKLLGAMGHQNVKGYLWYVYPNKVVEVK